MGVAAGLLHRDDLVVDLAEPAREERAAVDHHVDLVRARLDRRADVGELDVERRLPGRERRRDRGDVDARCRASARRATGTRLGYTQTAATEGMLGSPGSGCTALVESARTLPGVSAPSSVVRSIIRIARSSAKSFDSRLIDRLASSAARASSATASTEPSRGRRPPPGSSSDRGSATVWLMSSV